EIARYSTDETVDSYYEQLREPGSLLNFYRELIRLRNEHPALTYGEIDHSGMHIEEVVSFRRIHENEELLVLHNVSDVEITLTMEEKNSEFTEVVFVTTGGTVESEDGNIILPAYTTVVLERN
ncbi:MAG: DUF3459 domain-containing protein, partial [Cyclobacteriaceae bacterium]